MSDKRSRWQEINDALAEDVRHARQPRRALPAAPSEIPEDAPADAALSALRLTDDLADALREIQSARARVVSAHAAAVAHLSASIDALVTDAITFGLLSPQDDLAIIVQMHPAMINPQMIERLAWLVGTEGHHAQRELARAVLFAVSTMHRWDIQSTTGGDDA
jgi:hypothetical protein